MMRCASAAEAIGLLVSGEIDGETRAALEVHLRSCSSCAREAARLREAVDLLGVDEVPDPGPAYWASFGRRLRTRITLAERRRAAARWLPLAAAAATIVLLAGLAIRAYRPAPALPLARTIPSHPAAGQAAEQDERIDAVLRRAASATEGRREMRAILDEMVPGDPLEIDDAFDSLPPDEGQPTSGEPSDTQG